MQADTTLAPTDELYAQAVALAKKKASVAYVQRKLGCGYQRAAALLERMVRDGVIADYAGRREQEHESPAATDAIAVLRQMLDALQHEMWAWSGASGYPPDSAPARTQAAHAAGAALLARWRAPQAPAASGVPLTDEQIEAAIASAVRNGSLSWLGFKKDDAGKYTLPVLSKSDFQAARAIEAAHGITGTPPG